MKNNSYIFVLIASILWGSAAAVGKMLLFNLDILQVLFFNNLFAFLGLLVAVLFLRKSVIIKSYNKSDYFTFAWMGFLGTFFYALLFFGALKLLPAQEAFIINYLWPIMVVIFAALILKEKTTWQKFLGLALSFAGVVIVIAKGDFSNLQFSNWLGILSAFIGAVAYGLFSVLGKKQNYDKFTSTMFYYFFSFFYSSIAVLLISNIPKISAYQLISLIWLGVFTSGLAFVFWFLALKYGDAVKMSNIILITPFISLVYTHFLIGEKILISSIIGLMIIVAGIMIQSITGFKEHKTTDKEGCAEW